MAHLTSPLNAQTRHNGIEWLDYGPAIITSAKAIRVTLQEGNGEVSQLIIDEQHLKSTKNWLLTHFENTLNRSPVAPNNNAVEFVNTVTIYASKDGRDADMLLQIPLTPFTLNVNAQEYEKQLKLLKELIKAR